MIKHIDEKFKEMSPDLTVQRIRDILQKLGIEIEEFWNDSGLEHCHSLNISTKDGAVLSNGKGITRELARASAYGEFMERLQSGLFLYKYQSIQQNPDMHLHTYAPDARYMTEQELIENGEWMDALIDTYGGLTRKKLAQQCKMYACSDRVLTVPYYSLFEDKYVYLPTGFVEQMYSANGCCVGNTRQEAWVHALSEIMERRGSVALLTGGKAARPIPQKVLERYPTAMSIINQIKAGGNFDVAVFDTSVTDIHPIVTTRIINKDTHTYVVNTGSDPVFEIALHRTLTEIFQGRNLKTFTSRHSGAVLNTVNDISPAHNVQNLLETGNGLFTMDFFTEELENPGSFSEFPDNSGKTNSQLLIGLLEQYRSLGKPVYVRNYSYLGFPCYKFVVPGFSESRGLRLTEPFQEYLSADSSARTLRDPLSASPVELQMLLAYYKQIQTIISKRDNFRYLSGVPLYCPGMVQITLACVTHRLGRFNETIAYLKSLQLIKSLDKEKAEYFSCLARYLELKKTGRPEEQIRLVLRKFYHETYTQMLYSRLDAGESPFEGFVLRCHHQCDQCAFRENCRYQGIKRIIAKAGAIYHQFTEGQAKENFTA